MSLFFLKRVIKAVILRNESWLFQRNLHLKGSFILIYNFDLRDLRDLWGWWRPFNWFFSDLKIMASLTSEVVGGQFKRMKYFNFANIKKMLSKTWIEKIFEWGPGFESWLRKTVLNEVLGSNPHWGSKFSPNFSELCTNALCLIWTLPGHPVLRITYNTVADKRANIFSYLGIYYRY